MAYCVLYTLIFFTNHFDKIDSAIWWKQEIWMKQIGTKLFIIFHFTYSMTKVYHFNWDIRSKQNEKWMKTLCLCVYNYFSVDSEGFGKSIVIGRNLENSWKNFRCVLRLSEHEKNVFSTMTMYVCALSVQHFCSKLQICHYIPLSVENLMS